MVKGSTPLPVLLILMHTTTMLLPSRVSDASFFAWHAYRMTKRDTKEDADHMVDRQIVPGMNRGG